jgi:hypothetical protein
MNELKVYESDGSNEMSDGSEGVTFLCLEVELKTMMIGGVEGLVAGTRSVPEDEGGVVWGFELVAVEFGADC